MLTATVGDVSVAGDCLDYEVMSVRRLVVIAFSPDGSSDSSALFIHVNNIDDHPPRFCTDHTEAIIAEGAPRGTVVTRLPPVYDLDHTRN